MNKSAGIHLQAEWSLETWSDPAAAVSAAERLQDREMPRMARKRDFMEKA